MAHFTLTTIMNMLISRYSHGLYDAAARHSRTKENNGLHPTGKLCTILPSVINTVVS
ncbi:hypothetical protein M404DRAFT_461262 [Pisolithus tinctorius Marx 270]|uniref:Uncharacterized protein n=1 Tax=Pisolithus tinctorius Marx 270 TaxID=870435 RepID=A0A0C3PXE3_PISTI|nr:hypothetical protein M404DRAFT_461262 [Pisolithus tinctorius Marx 270]